MEFLGPYHPIIVHTPIVMLIFATLFEIVGRANDVAWWRRAAFAMLVIGVLGAFFAVQSGEPASQKAEHAGVPEETVDAHGDLAKIALWLAAGALALRGAGALAKGNVKSAAGGLSLVLQVAAAVVVSVAAYRGGKLVYEHGANVTVNGQPVTHAEPGAADRKP